MSDAGSGAAEGVGMAVAVVERARAVRMVLRVNNCILLCGDLVGSLIDIPLCLERRSVLEQLSDQTPSFEWMRMGRCLRLI